MDAVTALPRVAETLAIGQVKSPAPPLHHWATSGHCARLEDRVLKNRACVDPIFHSKGKKETCKMKKLAALAIGIGLILGTVSFGQDTTDTTKKTEKKTKKKKGGDDTTTPDDKK
jgi:hypothetical protein